MKIDIKPTIISAWDYHEFKVLKFKFDEEFKIPFNFYEIGCWNRQYHAFFWPEGAEDELFEFIFTNQEAWEALTSDE